MLVLPAWCQNNWLNRMAKQPDEDSATVADLKKCNMAVCFLTANQFWTFYLFLIVLKSRCEDTEGMRFYCPLIIYSKSCTFCPHNPRVSDLKTVIFKKKVLLVSA